MLLSRLYKMCQLLLHDRDDREDHYDSDIFFTLNNTCTQASLVLPWKQVDWCLMALLAQISYIVPRQPRKLIL